MGDSASAPGAPRVRNPLVILARLVAGAWNYARIAWWGLVAPRVGRGRSLTVLQGVVLGPEGVLLSVRADLWGWELPGGTPEARETREETLVREIREETGLEVEVVRHVGDYVRTGFRPHTAAVFECRPAGGRLTTSNETRAVGWFDPTTPPDTLFPWYRAPLADALRDGPPVERHEVQGLASILAGMRIDLRMRLSLAGPTVRGR